MHTIGGDHHSCVERELQVAGHAQAGSLGAGLFHRLPAQIPVHREAQEGRRRQGPGQHAD